MRLRWIAAILAIFVMGNSGPANAGDPIAQVEREIRDLPVEWGVCIDPYTYAIRWQGTSNQRYQVRTPYQPCYGAIFTHNHIEVPYLSYDDLAAGVILKAVQMRATGRLQGKAYTCVLDYPERVEPYLAEAKRLYTLHGPARAWEILFYGLGGYRCWSDKD